MAGQWRPYIIYLVPSRCIEGVRFLIDVTGVEHIPVSVCGQASTRWAGWGQDFLQDFTFWGGGVEGLWGGGSSLGPLGVKHKVSKKLGGGGSN